MSLKDYLIWVFHGILRYYSDISLHNSNFDPILSLYLDLLFCLLIWKLNYSKMYLTSYIRDYIILNDTNIILSAQN